MPRQPKIPFNPEMLDEFNKWRESQNLPPVIPAYKKQLYSIYISPEAFIGLNSLARNLRYFFGDKTSVSAFLEALGLGTITVVSHDQHHSPGIPTSAHNESDDES
jgi:hypothetical protein